MTDWLDMSLDRNMPPSLLILSRALAYTSSTRFEVRTTGGGGWVTLRARWVTLRARWVTLRDASRGVSLSTRWAPSLSRLFSLTQERAAYEDVKTALSALPGVVGGVVDSSSVPEESTCVPWVTLTARWVAFFISLGDAKSSLGGVYISLGDAKSSLGGVYISLGDAKSSLGGVYISQGDAKSSLGGVYISLGDAKSSLGGVYRCDATRARLDYLQAQDALIKEEKAERQRLDAVKQVSGLSRRARFRDSLGALQFIKGFSRGRRFPKQPDK
jgi:hypothetical protein